MEKVLKFLSDSKTFYLATLENGIPQVRPLGFVMEYDDKLCFCTADEKPTSIQMKANPAVAVSAAQGMEYLRINGKAQFLNDEAAVKKALEILPPLAQLIRPGKLEIFCITEATATFASLTEGVKETVEF